MNWSSCLSDWLTANCSLALFRVSLFLTVSAFQLAVSLARTRCQTTEEKRNIETATRKNFFYFFFFTTNWPCLPLSCCTTEKQREELKSNSSAIQHTHLSPALRGNEDGSTIGCTNSTWTVEDFFFQFNHENSSTEMKKKGFPLKRCDIVYYKCCH